MEILRILKKLFGLVLEPIRHNGRFFFFMYMLGIVASLVVVPRRPNAHPYEFLWLELFFDIYVVCLFLCVFPRKVRKYVRGLFALVAYLLTIVDVFCFVKFQSTLNPTMLLLVGETDRREAGEFFSSYFNIGVLFSGVGLVLLVLLLHFLSLFIPRIKRRFITKMGMGESSCGNLFSRLRPVFGMAAMALLLWSCVATWHNKREMADMFSKQSIGQVEHELNTQGHAEFYLPVYRLAFSLFSNHLASQQIMKLIAAKDRAEVDSCSFRSPNIVLIIGESYNKHHSQLYGYEKETTPRQVKRRQTDRLVPFTDVIAPWNLTSFVFKNVFSMHVVGQEGDWCDYPLFPELFRKAGYHVTFITNQFLPKAKEAVYDFSGGFFLNDPELSAAQFDTRNERVHVFDEGILYDYDEMLKDGKLSFETKEDGSRGELSRNLVIFHVMGQHVSYKGRYSKSRRKWFGNDYNRPDLTSREREVIAHYDNATLYNDSIVDQVLTRFEDEDAIVIYMPDHGEECFGEGYRHCGRDHSSVITPRLAHQEFEIPFWIWCSHKYAVTHPDIFSQVIEAKNRRLMTDALPHLLLYLAGISSKDYHEEYNILSPVYDERRPRIMKSTTDYDQLMEENHGK